MLMRASANAGPALDECLPPVESPAAALRVDGGAAATAPVRLAEETAVAFEFNGISHAVMLASPADLEDFALGFSLSEGLLDSPSEFFGMEPRVSADGVTLAIEVAASAFVRLKARRRTLAGRTGCGICGAESLQQVRRSLPALTGRGPRLAPAAIERAHAQVPAGQRLQRSTGAAHAAAWCTPAGEITCLREDVGRHNALDKLIGALARDGTGFDAGFALITSRASLEMVQKSATVGIAVLAAVSAPTAAAVQAAQACGQTLIGFARGASFSVYTCPWRIETGAR